MTDERLIQVELGYKSRCYLHELKCNDSISFMANQEIIRVLYEGLHNLHTQCSLVMCSICESYEQSH